MNAIFFLLVVCQFLDDFSVLTSFLSPVKKVLKVVPSYEYHSFEHEIDVYTFDELKGRKCKESLATIIGKNKVVLLQINFWQKPFIYSDDQAMYLKRYVPIFSHGLIVTAIAPAADFSPNRIVKIWDELKIFDGAMKTEGTAITFNRWLATNRRKSYDYTTDRDNENVLLVSNLQKYVPGMSLLMNDKLIGIAFHHDPNTRITKFAKMTTDILNPILIESALSGS